MKVLSLMEPWGSLIKEKVKYIETRSWKTNYRGDLYIHTSLKKIPKNDKRIQELVNLLKDKDIKYGYIIAENPTEYKCGEYDVGRYAWVLKDMRKIEPIQAKGHLGIWNY